MWSIIEAAGWPIWTIIISSVIALAIILERSVSLRKSLVLPKSVVEQVLTWDESSVNDNDFQKIAQSPLGAIVLKGWKNKHRSRELLKEALEDEARQQALVLERYLTTLGTVAAMAPLLGLLGTVIGMIEIFGTQTAAGSDPQALAHGISVALYNTAFGLIVAIPSMMFYRHFRAKVDRYLVEMEAQAQHLVDTWTQD